MTVMTPAELQSLRHLPHFPAAAASLVAAVGVEAAAALMTAWPGQRFPVPARLGGATRPGEANWARLADVAGEAAAAVIVRLWGGQDLYIPTCAAATRSVRHDDVRRMFDRLTHEGQIGRASCRERV
jgi:hypothetical protein